MSTEEALREYDTCAEKIFSSRNKKWYARFALLLARFQLCWGTQPPRTQRTLATILLAFFKEET
jgi:hypothetical protein